MLNKQILKPLTKTLDALTDHLLIRVMDASWEEDKHPRADNGQFGKGSGGGGTKEPDWAALQAKNEQRKKDAGESSKPHSEINPPLENFASYNMPEGARGGGELIKTAKGSMLKNKDSWPIQLGRAIDSLTDHLSQRLR
jgi:hypothetical protein